VGAGHRRAHLAAAKGMDGPTVNLAIWDLESTDIQ
jgi:hypothetical protein